ncbi:MAG TPA: hypothetical protein VNX40_13610 [Mucilaginibacter sp.]|jgi:hypothetical protein|nr:hypothetical protein [Mucilaginibacter sp.]
MKPLYKTLATVAALFMLAASCTTSIKSRNKCGPCPLEPVQLPHMNFRVVDKTTGKDLFFGSGAPYKISQLAMHHLVNGKPDTVLIAADTVSHIFFAYVPTVHMVDTVTMNIANLPQDILLFNTATVGDCCPYLRLNSISFDGTVVFTNTNGPSLVILQK